MPLFPSWREYFANLPADVAVDSAMNPDRALTVFAPAVLSDDAMTLALSRLADGIFLLRPAPGEDLLLLHHVASIDAGPPTHNQLIGALSGLEKPAAPLKLHSASAKSSVTCHVPDDAALLSLLGEDVEAAMAAITIDGNSSANIRGLVPVPNFLFGPISLSADMSPGASMPRPIE